jgi:hypothetical protein
MSELDVLKKAVFALVVSTGPVRGTSFGFGAL